jgi:heat shock protein HslJ
MRKLILTAVIIAVLAVNCKSTAGLTDISDALGKDWKLIEVRVNNRNTEFDRKTLVRDGFGEIFTLKIDAENISGVGAPNRYSAPYTVSEEDPLAVTIAVVRSTLMAPIHHPEKLKEHEFFIYIQNTYKWGLSSGKLELHSKTGSGAEVVMVFSL